MEVSRRTGLVGGLALGLAILVGLAAWMALPGPEPPAPAPPATPAGPAAPPSPQPAARAPAPQANPAAKPAQAGPAASPGPAQAPAASQPAVAPQSGAGAPAASRLPPSGTLNLPIPVPLAFAAGPVAVGETGSPSDGLRVRIG